MIIFKNHSPILSLKKICWWTKNVTQIKNEKVEYILLQFKASTNIIIKSLISHKTIKLMMIHF